MCASRVATCGPGMYTEILMSEGYQESCGYALYKSLLTYVAHVDLIGDPLQGTCHAHASEICITKVRKISTQDFVGSYHSTWRKRTWIFEPSLVVSGTDKLVIAYFSVWPLARRAIVGISFPPIPWPMTLWNNFFTKNIPKTPKIELREAPTISHKNQKRHG